MNKIFKWFTLSDKPETLKYVWWFAKSFEPRNFESIDRLFMCYMQFCAKLSIVPKRESLASYLITDGKRDMFKYNIKLETMSAYDYKEASQLEEAFRVLSNEAMNTFDVYMSEDLEGREFPVDMYMYMSEMKSNDIQNTMLQFYPRLTDGSDITDVTRELRNKLSVIDSVYDEKKLKQIDFVQSEDCEAEMKFICKTGIPAIDEDIGGIYTRLITTLNAQPSGGKTKFGLIHYIYQILTVAKKDCIFYELELSATQVKNILIAYHICVLYDGRVKLPDSLLNRKSELSPEQLRIYESAKIDLFESGKFGNLIIRNECIVEELEDDLIADVKGMPNLKFIGIDYMGLIRSNPPKGVRTMVKYEIITEAYEIVRRILLMADVGALCINQYNDEGIAAAFAGKAIRSGHVQGGHIVERHTDYDLSITYTEEQQLAGLRDLQNSKTRGSAGFGRVQLATDLSVSIFKQEQKI